MKAIYIICFVVGLCGCVDSVSHTREKVDQSNIIVDEDLYHNDSIYLIVKDKDKLSSSDTVKIEIINNKDTICSTGQYYKIEQLVGDHWVAVPLGPGIFYDIGYEIQAHNSRKFEIDLNGTKDVLRKGIYRISKIVKFRGEELVVSDEVTIHEKK
ncbi:hypothetical protein IMSAGC006_01566 [Muribaculaceae bacterium]|jgi:hypothetical protein|uniref:immunoglobulin-like domain-containing protein n=1 Tax=Bacteroidales TaxID=171549 RepID=UPI000F498AB1|nr:MULTISPECIES: immunoglobulin-like domain-containing protein [Bacteroidales]ROS84674.1 hypothetical protein EEL39_16755 [Muribaculaceae bacterium Isolate-080 (Janvier)]GFI06819.1 hypothetical protein IMSAGC006_01566 [Muribaculaceae bacterium]